ncbi:hypothetical protein BGZ98_006410, partial [Dissophora globulifera]
MAIPALDRSSATKKAKPVSEKSPLLESNRYTHTKDASGRKGGQAARTGPSNFMVSAMA